MYFTRPKIKPLNWDLKELVDNGIYLFDGFTSDNSPVNIKYRGGWLQVWHGDPGASLGEANHQVVEERIGPPYHWGLLAEQACDLLGITINGKKPILTEEQRLQAAKYEPILDWSGETTYWQSFNYMFPDDVSNFRNEIESAFPDFKHVIQLHDHSGPASTAPNDKEFEEAGSKLDFEIPGAYDFSLKTQFYTYTDEGKEFVKIFNSIMEKSFFSAHQYIDMETKEVLKHHNEENPCRLYSTGLKKWCLEKNNRYLSVGYSSAESRKEIWGNKDLSSSDKDIFYGLRPLP